MHTRGAVACVAAIAFLGCSGEDEARAPVPGEAWAPLITGTWSVPAGEERYLCVRQTVTEDTLVKSFGAISPAGTHHTVLSVGPPSGPDGSAACEANENNRTLIFGSGVGEYQDDMPEGVAVHLRPGDQLLLNIHLFNTSGGTLEGTSGTKFRAASADEISYDADGTLMGTISLDIPPGKETTAVGLCSVHQEATVFSVFPHMHQLGKHMKVTLQSASAGDVVVRDAPYDFNQQTSYDTPLVKLVPGDTVRVECTYENPTAETVHFGESTNEEMCFAAIRRFPATGEAICVGAED